MAGVKALPSVYHHLMAVPVLLGLLILMILVQPVHKVSVFVFM
ncbi:hypothetical protein E2C01_098833 [Portunus trituberculatus]|uniref:Uncharacterized protein n=1 Tax=Portunus trituberculatus TaxID=210409 RepID=A0A5B7KD46_PORTR|nr:hypothetical protein [Portunus trituberculatus]